MTASTGRQAARQTQVQAGQPSSWPRVSGTSARATDAETPSRAERVQPGPAVPARVRHHERGGDQRRRAHRHVHQEDGPPAQAEDVGLQQQAAEDLAGHEAQPHGHAEPGQRPAPLRAPGTSP